MSMCVVMYLEYTKTSPCGMLFLGLLAIKDFFDD